MSERRSGVVVRSTGSSYTVRDTGGTEVEARIRGKLRLKGVRSTNPVAVGDRVALETDETGEVFIAEIAPRTNYIIRRSPNLSRESHILAANVDQAVVVATLFNPETKTEFIDRFLVTCEAYRIPAVVVLNKADMACKVPGAVEEFAEIYRTAGYPVLAVSGLTGQGIDRLREWLHGKVTLLSGNSGVGKSTLIKRLSPDAEVRIGEISEAHRKGRHTTTFSQMFPLPGSGYLIDTPGIKGFGLLDIEARELYRFFPEMMERSTGCQYYNCTHTHEPGCAVRSAVECGAIASSRYVSYLKMLEEDEKYRK